MSTNSTFAWFVSSSNASIAGGNVSGTALTTAKTEPTSLGSFSVKPTIVDAVEADRTIDLTTTTGTSWVWLKSDMSAKVEVTPDNPTADYQITGIIIEYTGSLTLKADIQTAYSNALAAVSKTKANVTVSSTNANARFCTAEAGTGSYTGSADLTLAHTWTDDEITAKKFTITLASSEHVYVACTGSDSAVETATSVPVTFTANLKA